MRPETDSEIALLNEVAKASDRSVAELEKVWRQPSFSIASITSSGASNKTVIPKRVSADVSMRIVPDQVSTSSDCNIGCVLNVYRI